MKRVKLPKDISLEEISKFFGPIVNKDGYNYINEGMKYRNEGHKIKTLFLSYL